MVHSHCPEPEPEQAPKTNGLYNSVQKFSHCIFTGTVLGPIVPIVFLLIQFLSQSWFDQCEYTIREFYQKVICLRKGLDFIECL